MRSIRFFFRCRRRRQFVSLSFVLFWFFSALYFRSFRLSPQFISTRCRLSTVTKVIVNRCLTVIGRCDIVYNFSFSFRTTNFFNFISVSNRIRKLFVSSNLFILFFRDPSLIVLSRWQTLEKFCQKDQRILETKVWFVYIGNSTVVHMQFNLKLLVTWVRERREFLLCVVCDGDKSTTVKL